MSIVRENISFQRGLDPKQSLDVGRRQLAKTTEGLSQIFKEDFKDYGVINVSAYSYEGLIEELIYSIPGNLSFDGKYYRSLEQEDILKQKIYKWFIDNTDYKVSFHSIIQRDETQKINGIPHYTYSVELVKSKIKNKI